MKTTYKSKILLKDGIFDGYLATDNGIITYVGDNCPSDDFIEIENQIIAPGFIDIHCHSSFKNSAGNSPEEVCAFHLSHGTTTLLLSFYRDIPHEQLLTYLDKTKKAMTTCKNLYGAHLEGPYLNSNLGSGFDDKPNPSPNFENCKQYIETGIIRQWTSAPEIEGTIELINIIARNGIVPAIGHSAANYKEVKKAYESGARIVTHIFDATKAPVSDYIGTLEADFNESCMLMDDMYYEVICDSKWIHVRKEKLELLIKTVGIDRVVAITDMSAVDKDEDDKDVSFINGILSGTKLTMDRVAINLFNGGFSLNDIFKMTSLNPAKALGLTDRGEIAVGKKADLILIDDKAKFIKVL